MGALPWIAKAGHDVSGEARDDHGQWTAGAGGNPSAGGNQEASQEAAEEKAKRFVSGKVSLRGVDAEVAHKITGAIAAIYEASPDLPKLRGIEAKKFNGKGGLHELAPAAYHGLNGILHINTAILGSAKKFKAWRKEADDAEQFVRDKLQSGQLDPAVKAKAERLLAFERQLVDGSLAGLIAHEMGHHVDWSVLMLGDMRDRRQAIIDRRAEHHGKVSARAADDAFEYIAESFVAHRKGEKIDPDLAEAFKGAKL